MLVRHPLLEMVWLFWNMELGLDVYTKRGRKKKKKEKSNKQTKQSGKIKGRKDTSQTNKKFQKQTAEGGVVCWRL